MENLEDEDFSPRNKQDQEEPAQTVQKIEQPIVEEDIIESTKLH